MPATVHLWICKIQTKRRFNRVAAVISPHFYFMNNIITINQVYSLQQGLTVVQAVVLSRLLEYSLTAEKVIKGDNVYYKYSYEDICSMFPIVFKIGKRVYKNMHILEKKGIINIKKIGKLKLYSFVDKEISHEI